MVQLHSTLLKTGSAPTVTVTDAEFKTFAKIDGTGDDALVTLLNLTATNYIQDVLNRTFFAREYTLYLDCFPTDLDENIGKPYIEVQTTPLISVDSITYVDTDGATQTLASTEYTADIFADGPTRILEAYDKTWPAIRNVSNAVIVTMTCGFATAAAVPEEYKQILKLYFTHMYENREAYREERIVEVPRMLQMLIDRYRVKRFL
jgi:uncharacterized phiE125 gp8 family phage protein